MAPVPVVCDQCGRLWVSENLIGVGGGGTLRVTMTGNKISPCPYCGGTGSVPDGVYDLSENAATYLGELKPDELRALLRVMTEARDASLSAEEVAERIATEVPAAARFGGLLKDAGLPLATWLVVLIGFLQLLLPLAERQNQALTQEQTTQAFVQALEEVQRQQSPAPAQPVHRNGPKIGRNDPCHCGSGKKFKHCHGR